MLRFGADGDILEVGPVFYGDDTACVRCFRHAMTPDAEQPARDRAGLSADGTTDLLASMVSARLLATLTSQAHPKAPRIITRVDLRGNIPSIREVTPDLTCSLCSGGTPPADEESRDVLAYDWRVKRWSDRLEPQLTLSPAENVRIATLQRERMSTLHTAPRKKLPPPEPAAAPMSESVIADLLCRSVGFRSPGDAPPAYARWAPSGGNLASPAAYIITHPDIFGIPGSVFRYEDMSHELVAVHNDTVSIAEFLADTDLTARDADSAVVVLVAAVGRLRRKYGDFSWRLAHLDAGCAALQLALIAESHGFSAIFASHWPVTIADVLDLDPQQEVVTAIAGISTTPRLSGE
jgi:SagB-type dehydrogenase family enzyme